jgi:hypothetical protein
MRIGGRGNRYVPGHLGLGEIFCSGNVTELGLRKDGPW